MTPFPLILLLSSPDIGVPSIASTKIQNASTGNQTIELVFHQFSIQNVMPEYIVV